MPGRAEYGLLAGLGQGIAQAGQMAFADHLQQMREARLAKIASDAADGKFARDKELLGMETANRREELQMRNDAELGLVGARADADIKGKKELADYYLSKGLDADGGTSKGYEPKFKAVTDGMGGGITAYVDEKSGKTFDMTNPAGVAEWKAYQDYLRGGATAVAPKNESGAGSATPSATVTPERGAAGIERTNTPPAKSGGLLSRAQGAVSDWLYDQDPMQLRADKNYQGQSATRMITDAFSDAGKRLDINRPRGNMPISQGSNAANLPDINSLPPDVRAKVEGAIKQGASLEDVFKILGGKYGNNQIKSYSGVPVGGEFSANFS